MGSAVAATEGEERGSGLGSTGVLRELGSAVAATTFEAGNTRAVPWFCPLVLDWFQMAQAFRYETRIRFVDTDASGRIHYTSLFKFFEAAETEFFRAFDISYTKGTFNFPRVHAECDIKLALVHDDVIEIEVCLTKLGTSSMRFEFKTWKEGQVAATGAIVMVCMDRKTQRAMPIPGDLRARFAEILIEG